MKTLKFASVVLLSTLILTGCGSGSGSGSGESTLTVAAPIQPSAPVTPPLDVHGVSVDIDPYDSSVIFTQDFNHRPDGEYTGQDLKDDFNCTESGNLSDMNACTGVSVILEELIIENGEIKVTFEKDKIGTSLGFSKGLGFDYNETYLTFQVRFDENYDMSARGGKLMGVGGHPDGHLSPTGCKSVGPNEGFSVRNQYMNTGLLQYVYHQDKNAGCGDQIYLPNIGGSTGNFQFRKNITYTVELRTKMNTPFESNGEVETFINGESMNKETGYVFSENGSHGITEFIFQLYIGGQEDHWKLDNPSTIYLDNFTLSTNRVVSIK